MNTNTPTPEAIATELLKMGPPLWQAQVVRVLQILGSVLFFVGSADFLQLAALIPADWAKWLVVSGPTLRFTAEPVMLFIGDWLDDGLKNNSFKLTPLLAWGFIGLLTLGSIGCAGWTVYSDGKTVKIVPPPSIEYPLPLNNSNK